MTLGISAERLTKVTTFGKIISNRGYDGQPKTNFAPTVLLLSTDLAAQLLPGTSICGT